MGLDACVHCDCYETGKVRTAPPQPELVYVDPETGGLSLRWEHPNANQHLFYGWLDSACEHGPLGTLVSYRLGNIAGIALLRKMFSRTPDQLPVLLSKVVYNGTHAGDFLESQEVEKLAVEMDHVATLHFQNQDEETYLREFEAQMRELIEGARRVRKPIVF